jgi:hypothetical protein
MKKRRLLITLGTLLFLLVITIGGFYFASFQFDFSIDLPFMKRETLSASRQILTGSRDLMELAVVEYLYKAVFPYDLIPRDTDFRDLFARLFRKEQLTAKEEQLIELYRLCAEIGIDLSLEQYRFAVITLRVKGGFDFQERGMTIFEEPASRHQGSEIVVSLPAATITDLVIEDERLRDYPYPDIDAGPAQWKAITALVEEEIRAKVIEEGILEEAEKRGKAYLRAVLKQAGYERISFRIYASNSE